MMKQVKCEYINQIADKTLNNCLRLASGNIIIDEQATGQVQEKPRLHKSYLFFVINSSCSLS